MVQDNLTDWFNAQLGQGIARYWYYSPDSARVAFPLSKSLEIEGSSRYQDDLNGNGSVICPQKIILELSGA